jgi:hypothetical protein
MLLSQRLNLKFYSAGNSFVWETGGPMLMQVGLSSRFLVYFLVTCYKSEPAYDDYRLGRFGNLFRLPNVIKGSLSFLSHSSERKSMTWLIG